MSAFSILLAIVFPASIRFACAWFVRKLLATKQQFPLPFEALHLLAFCVFVLPLLIIIVHLAFARYGNLVEYYQHETQHAPRNTTLYF